jgi:hypothetical protein
VIEVPNILRVLVWSILSLGMLFLAVMFFWVFLIVIGVFVIARIIYLKLFNKDSKGTVTMRTYKVNFGPRQAPDNHQANQDHPYTTVIDADDPDQEYKIPKLK